MKIRLIAVAGLTLLATQNIMAFGLGNVAAVLNTANETAEVVNEANETANNVNEKAKSLKKYSTTEVVKDVAVEGSKGAAVGAVQGLATGSVVTDGVKGGISGVKKGLNKF